MSPAKFEHWLDEARGCSPRDVEGIKAVLSGCHNDQITDGYLSLVISAIHDATEIPAAALRELSNTLRNTVGERVCSTPAAVAEAYRDEVRKDFDEFFYDEGCYWLWKAPVDEENAQEDEGVFLRRRAEEVRRDMRRRLPDVTLLQREHGQREAERHLAAIVASKGYLADAMPGLNCCNGYVTWESETQQLEVYEHDACTKSRIRVPIDFDRDAVAPAFVAGLERVLPDQSACDALQEFVGSILFGRLPEKENVRRMLVLHGATRSGKSTLIEVLQLLFPPSAMASVSPEDWSSEFERARLSGVVLNVCTELKGGKLP
ncbi:hypothetical protein [Phenylobacterium sp.]|uniref:hypothetical protein n=1 Tax=Phenylobacterium sp. TaxID=1871053 RepID=UPI0035B3F9B5